MILKVIVIWCPNLDKFSNDGFTYTSCYLALALISFLDSMISAGLNNHLADLPDFGKDTALAYSSFLVVSWPFVFACGADCKCQSSWDWVAQFFSNASQVGPTRSFVFFGSLNGGVVFASQVKASSAEFLWDAMQGCCGAAAEISFAAHAVEVTEVPAVLAEDSSRLEGMCG